MDRDTSQLSLFDPDAFNPWKRAFARLLLAARRGRVPRSLTELSRLTGISRTALRRCERLAQQESGR